MNNIKTFEQFNNYEKVDEGLFSYDQKNLKKDLETGKPVEEIFNRAFAESLKMGAVKKIVSSASEESKKNILQQAAKDPDGIGAVRIKGNELVYLPKASVKYKGVGSGISGTSLK